MEDTIVVLDTPVPDELHRRGLPATCGRLVEVRIDLAGFIWQSCRPGAEAR